MNDPVDALAAFTGLARVPLADMTAFAPAWTARALPAGKVLYRQGDPGATMALLLIGACTVQSGSLEALSREDLDRVEVVVDEDAVRRRFPRG